MSGNERYKRNDSNSPDGGDASECEIIYGRNPVTEALKSGRSINKVLICREDENGRLKAIEALCREKKIIVQYRTRKELDGVILKQTGERNVNHQGAAAFIAPAEYVQPEDIIAFAREKNEDPFVIILDGIQDPHNLGAVIRTADAVGAHGVIIPKRRSCAVTGTVAKTSAGALSHVRVARVSNIVQTLDYLKSEGLWVAGTDLTGETEFFNAKLGGPIALVIGSEGSGMADLTRKNCDYVLTIPMKGQVSSLNASVAAGVVMYEIFRQRGGAANP
ncbi:MAG: 23S rRNA (guanosine(2251)-2'-O)-methyltransferase RlmB [Clostridia bacterium]|nr:23S rRNA (guanosine(2251)-2'-O)-methyltransferase RlmB [Clostridia bacterium]